MQPATKPKVMTLTDAAAARAREILTLSPRPAEGLRLTVKKGGCAGMEYAISFVEAADPSDELVEDKGVRLYIDPKAVLFLLGAEMDYQEDQFRMGFVFNNPNQVSACGCGESVTLKPASPGDLSRLSKN